MGKPTKPRDLYVVNGWYLNIPIAGIMSKGLFESINGIGKQTGTVDIVDAGSNRKFKFGDQIVDFTEMTLTRTYDGSTADRALEVLVNTCMEAGVKLPVTAIKMHWGKEVFTIAFEGFRFTSSTLPEMNIGGTEKFTVSYGATCDDWEIVPSV